MCDILYTSVTVIHIHILHALVCVYVCMCCKQDKLELMRENVSFFLSVLGNHQSHNLEWIIIILIGIEIVLAVYELLHARGLEKQAEQQELEAQRLEMESSE
jgi:sulfur transfer complex TusBCD TusB component (DsrH family)